MSTKDTKKRARNTRTKKKNEEIEIETIEEIEDEEVVDVEQDEADGEEEEVVISEDIEDVQEIQQMDVKVLVLKSFPRHIQGTRYVSAMTAGDKAKLPYAVAKRLSEIGRVEILG